jgi:hypothetical protein
MISRLKYQCYAVSLPYRINIFAFGKEFNDPVPVQTMTAH